MYQHENAGLLFYKFYFQGINFDPDRKKDPANESLFKQAHARMLKVRLPETPEKDPLEQYHKGLQVFEAATTYPGLLIGSGYQHETNILGEWKLGFFFDHTLGLPVIPGSSIKGVVRNAFNYPALINELLGKKLTEAEVRLLEADMFEGKDEDARASRPEGGKPAWVPRPMSGHDVFFDAIPVKNGPDGLFATDTLTPHNPTDKDYGRFREPVPLPFLKVAPGVVFRFRFQFFPNPALGITAVQKLSLVEGLIVYFGIGAKTAVGYGKFESEATKRPRTGASPEQPQIDTNGGNGGGPQPLPSYKPEDLKRVFNSGKFIEGEVRTNTGGTLQVAYLLDGKEALTLVKCAASDTLPIGTRVKLTVKSLGTPAKGIQPLFGFAGKM